jgi:addiction module HigA family antidote
LKQEQIAEKLDISQSLVSQILNGNRSVSKRVALRLAEQFGNNPAFWLFATLDEIKEAIRKKNSAN